jgi:hypothetical protein
MRCAATGTSSFHSRFELRQEERRILGDEQRCCGRRSRGGRPEAEGTGADICCGRKLAALIVLNEQHHPHAPCVLRLVMMPLSCQSKLAGSHATSSSVAGEARLELLTLRRGVQHLVRAGCQSRSAACRLWWEEALECRVADHGERRRRNTARRPRRAKASESRGG